MTDNHLLLYRLTELMLEHEQHILPVDLLFDDDQIGDFVKSIQIDSPYQQMILEDVLTESVRDEILHVSFTVEGYFHFVLGLVLERKFMHHSAEEIFNAISNNNLNGLKEGVEYFLIRKVANQEFDLLCWFIDYGVGFNSSTVDALAYGYIQAALHPIGQTIGDISKALILVTLAVQVFGIGILVDSIESAQEWDPLSYVGDFNRQDNKTQGIGH